MKCLKATCGKPNNRFTRGDLWLSSQKGWACCFGWNWHPSRASWEPGPQWDRQCHTAGLRAVRWDVLRCVFKWMNYPCIWELWGSRVNSYETVISSLCLFFMCNTRNLGFIVVRAWLRLIKQSALQPDTPSFIRVTTLLRFCFPDLSELNPDHQL